MSEEALQACMDRHLEHAALVFVLDEELGTHHGLSWADFVLLTLLDAAGGAAPATELARTLCTPASHLLLRLLPLEKTGLVSARQMATASAASRCARKAGDCCTKRGTRPRTPARPDFASAPTYRGASPIWDVGMRMRTSIRGMPALSRLAPSVRTLAPRHRDAGRP